MRNRNLKYIATVFILLLAFDLIAQTNEMAMNKNRIDSDFISNAEFKNQSKTENKVHLILEKGKEKLYSIYILNKTKDSITILNKIGVYT